MSLEGDSGGKEGGFRTGRGVGGAFCGHCSAVVKRRKRDWVQLLHGSLITSCLPDVWYQQLGLLCLPIPKCKLNAPFKLEIWKDMGTSRNNKIKRV